jgi:hypothetical protein
MRALLSALALSIAITAPAAAQEPGSVELPKVVQFSVPASPALKFIGSNPEEISRPTSLKALATSILSGIDAGGRVQQGVAAEIAPVQFFSRTMDAQEYTQPWNYFLANLGISLGTLKAASDSTSTSIGAGIRAVLLDRTDPMSSAAHVDAVGSALEQCLPTVNGRPVPINRSDTAQIRTLKACIITADTASRSRYRRDHWNDYALAVGVAGGQLLRNSEWDERQGMGMQAWATLAGPICLRAALASPFCRASQGLLELQYEKRDSTFETPDAVDQLAFGARATLGTEKVGFFGEILALRRLDPPASVKKSVSEMSLGFEFKVGDNLWASTGVGSRYNDAIDESQVVVLANLRVNLTADRKFSNTVPVP